MSDIDLPTTGHVDKLLEHMDGLKSKVNQQLELLDDTNHQYAVTVAAVNDFCVRVFNHVNGNEDIPQVNKALVDGLIELQRYVNARPNDIEQQRNQLQAQQKAYDECISVCKQTIENIQFSGDIVVKEQSAHDRIRAQLDDDGGLLRRSVGGHPEKIKDIRAVQAEMSADEISEEDI